MKMKEGDIAVCLVDRPLGANVKKGERVKIVEMGEGNVTFVKYPVNRAAGAWYGVPEHFKLARPLQLENK